ncbi:unnamed protein product [Dovyalis caffra]|uniref:Uncharacterized protein n=1 Tax=Dovyalis caffra TaxID=77055 RepID=A0AAV1SGR2_9ROSI|nr:unnamed protein product [Dovyalis caffra]
MEDQNMAFGLITALMSTKPDFGVRQAQRLALSNMGSVFAKLRLQYKQLEPADYANRLD